MMHQLFITGIGTGVGKTLVSAVFVKALDAAYWKPIQSGDLQDSDSKQVKELTGAAYSIFPERYRLALAASPHKAAAIEQIQIHTSDFELPITNKPLIVEGAGGLFVPISEQEYIIDLIQKLELPVLLVVKDYLGCINHSILSLQALKARNIPLAYVVFNGDFDPDAERIIRKEIPPTTVLINLPTLALVNQETIASIAKSLKRSNLL